MRRRAFSLLLVGVASAPLAGRAQPVDMPVIGFLSGASPAPFAPYVAAFRAGLEAAGFVERRNVQVEYRWAEGDYARLPELAAELVAMEVDVLVSSGGDRPTQAAMAATSSIPIVFVGSDDPVRFGFVESLSRPGGNLTGGTLFTSELEQKKLDLLHELVPEAVTIGMLVNPANPTAADDARDIAAAAEAIGKQIRFGEANSAETIDAAFAGFTGDPVDGLIVGHDPFFNSQREQIVAAVARLGVPAIYEHREFVEAGGLMSYGNVISDNYRLAGDYAGRILDGAHPAELPVQQATRFELALNLLTADALGLEFPSAMLVRADHVVE